MADLSDLTDNQLDAAIARETKIKQLAQLRRENDPCSFVATAAADASAHRAALVRLDNDLLTPRPLQSSTVDSREAINSLPSVLTDSMEPNAPLLGPNGGSSTVKSGGSRRWLCAAVVNKGRAPARKSGPEKDVDVGTGRSGRRRRRGRRWWRRWWWWSFF